MTTTITHGRGTNRLLGRGLWDTCNRLGLPPEISAARKKERHRRCVSARLRALNRLARLFPEEYRHLYLAAKKQIYDKRGPLPGDDHDDPTWLP